jgi:hypothetical protein
MRTWSPCEPDCFALLHRNTEDGTCPPSMAGAERMGSRLARNVTGPTMRLRVHDFSVGNNVPAPMAVQNALLPFGGRRSGALHPSIVHWPVHNPPKGTAGW